MSTQRLPDDPAVVAPEVAPEPAAESAAIAEPASAIIEPAPTPQTIQPVALAAVPAPRFATARRIGRRMWPMATIALFVIGIGLGYVAFRVTQPVAPGTPAFLADPSLATGQTPTAVKDLVAAISSDNQAAIRAVLDPQPYTLLAGELTSMNFQTIDGVDTLSTYTHDNLTATEIVIRGQTAAGNLVAINLIVHEKDDVIVNFR